MLTQAKTGIERTTRHESVRRYSASEGTTSAIPAINRHFGESAK
jgi:hypothetical protein